VFENDSTSASKEEENVNGVVIDINFCLIQVSDDDDGVLKIESQRELKGIGCQDDQQTELRE
jgi:hypothetical protein